MIKTFSNRASSNRTRNNRFNLLNVFSIFQIISENSKKKTRNKIWIDLDCSNDFDSQPKVKAYSLHIGVQSEFVLSVFVKESEQTNDNVML